MGYFRDFREHLKALEKQEKLFRIRSPINKDTELHPMVRWQFRGLPESQRKAFLFENVIDSKGRHYPIPVAVAALAASREVYAIGLQCRPDEIPAKWQQALTRPIEPEMLRDGPCQEIIHQGADLEVVGGGLEMFPIPISTPGYDNAPYLTCANWITKDPETGIRNMGNYRGQIKGRTRFGASLGRNHDAWKHWEKCRRLGRPLEGAVVIGTSPSVSYASVQPVPYGVDELTIAGGLAREPVGLVKCKTVDLEVPATAEIVIEGIIPTNYLEPEGPFGESFGFVDTPRYKPCFEITCITHRKDPIYVSFISQLTPSESSKIREPGFEAMLLNRLCNQLGLKGVIRVAMHEPLCALRPYIVIQMRKMDPAEPWRAMYGILSSGDDLGKTIICVDEDIDPKDAESVNWALSYRMQADTDVAIVPGRRLSEKWRKLTPDPNQEMMSALLIDATRKTDLPPISLPKKEYMERAREIWEREGLPPLQPRIPWHGYSLGPWPKELEEEAGLAVRGEYFATGEKHAQRRKPPHEKGVK